MKFLFYSPVLLNNGGGCERWHCDVTNSIKNQGHEVEIVTANLIESNKWSDKYLENQLEGIKYTRLKFPIVAYALIPTIKNFRILLKKFKEADGVHFIFGFMGQDILMLLLKWFSGTPVLVGHHAPIFHSSKIHNLYMRTVSRFTMKFFDFHQTLNARDRDFFRDKWGIKNVYYIPSGIRVEKFLNTKKIPHPEFNYLLVGRYENQKGIDLALPAIEKFNKEFKNNNARFIFVGAGIQNDLINEYAQRNPNIINKGYTKYEEIPALYASSDIYLLPSREEPFGLVLIESWSSGMPILATKTEGPTDMLEPNINGWFIEQISTEEIYKGIKWVYEKYNENREELLKMEPACRRSGEEFSIDNTARRMVNLFKIGKPEQGDYKYS